MVKPLDSPSFAVLVHDLAVTHHGDNLRAMSQRTGIAYMTLSRLEHGETSTFHAEHIERLAKAYDLDVEQLYQLVARDYISRLRGIRPPVPITSRGRGRRPEPNSIRSRRRKKIAGVVGGILLAAIASVSPSYAAPRVSLPTGPLHVAAGGGEVSELPLLGSRRRRRRGRLLAPADMLCA